MKSKLVNLFTVCLITLAVIFPSLTVFGLVWEQHLKFVETQQNFSTSSQIQSECSASLQINSSINSDSNLYLNQDQTDINLSHRFKINQIHHLWRWLFLFVPFCIIVAIFLYDRYLVFRAHNFQQQVEMLEKLWQQSLEK